jgi:hypothetical protein
LTENKPGDPAVYDRIESLTDCETLQGEFKIAMNNTEARLAADPLRDVSLSYAEAALDRMTELGCPGGS